MSGPNRWPAIRVLLAWRDRVTLGGALCVALLGFWLAWRTGWPELALFGLLLAAAAHAVLRVAIEVVALVAETLMPQ
ncbi:hypothetical protein [Variovorax sp. JS1663]|uniref:hypothetical protein n=1 Tax=Variovorax sp. JS1663 TaxID=1851577 RepID=UPI000B34886C|nr:hypothetical protein [Variovorax sp. JS1663]OUM00133.1 hypothetical protein A8M77_22525 [Variovorax sp. JS1663]